MLVTRNLSRSRMKNIMSLVSLQTSCLDRRQPSFSWYSIEQRHHLVSFVHKSRCHRHHSLAWRALSTDDNRLNHPSTSFWEKLITNAVPSPLLPYTKLMRIDKPTGTWLLLLPSLWGIAIATPAGSLPSLSTMGLFTGGAILMRGAGCTINDLWDRDFDKRVARTRSRPLASGQLTNSDAVFFLGGQLGAALLILSTFDLNSMILGASSMVLVSTYPLFKRFSNWPQLVLGATFNWGILLGYSVVSGGNLSGLPFVLPLYAAGICWTVVYDTIYAHQDKIDDSLIGLKSTALKFGKNTKPWLSVFSVGMITNLGCTGLLTEQTWPFYAAVSAVGLHFVWQIKELNIDDVDNCWKLFRQNAQVGVILLLGIILSTWLKANQKPSDTCDTLVNNNKVASLT